jgi:hypothetical protein
MKQASLTFLALTLSAGMLLRADVTIRYQTEIKAMPLLQPLVDNLQKTQGTGVSVRMKGNKAYTTSGGFTQVFDFVKQEVTVIDPAHKTFAVLPVSQLSDALAAAMPQAKTQNDAAMKFLESIKTTSESRMTGQSAVILGVEAEEREVTISMEMPLPGQGQASAAMKIVMDIWTAKSGETLRVPAIRELAGYSAWQKYILNPASMLEKMAGKMNGVMTVLSPILEETSKNQSVILRMHMALFTPLTAMMAQRMAKPGEPAPAIDPNAPFMEVNQEVAELSSDPVDATLFEIPKDYTSVPAADLFGSVMHAQPTPSEH